MTPEYETALLAASKAIRDVQLFDPKSIVRASELGLSFNFSHAEESAGQIVAMFKQIDVSELKNLPISVLLSLNSTSESTIQHFQQALQFDPTSANASSTRDGIAATINSHPSTVFSVLSPIISYLKSLGPSAAADLVTELTERRKELDGLIAATTQANAQTNAVLEAARSAAGNIGVSQEASHFEEAARTHAVASENWKKATLGSAGLLLVYSVLTAFLHKWDWFMPTTNIGLTQFLVSKILIFGVLSYLLSLSAKNFLNHKHNEIVNKHRQNALLTYETMVSAGQTPEARNIVLQLAAGSIYQLHDTGYVKSSEAAGRGGIIEILPKTTIPMSPTGPSG